MRLSPHMRGVGHGRHLALVAILALPILLASAMAHPAVSAARAPEDFGSLATEMATVDVPVGRDPRGPEGAIPVMRSDLYFPSSGGPWPTVVFSPGTCDTKANYANWGPRLASRGFVVIVPNRRTAVEGVAFDLGLLGQCLSLHPEVNAEDLLRVLRWASAQDEVRESVLYGKVDAERVSVVGASLGGTFAALATALAREEGPALRASVLLDPGRYQGAKKEWTSEGVAPSLNVPTLVLAAQETPAPDPTNPPDNPFRPLTCEVGTRPECLLTPRHTFRALPPGLPKLGLEITGASHFEVADPDYVDGDLVTGEPRTGSPQQRLFQRYTFAWLEAWLGCDRSVQPYLNGPAAAADQSAGRITLFDGSTSFPPDGMRHAPGC